MEQDVFTLENEHFSLRWERTRRLIWVTFTGYHTEEIALAFRSTARQMWEECPGFRDSAVIFNATGTPRIAKEARRVHQEGGETHPFPLIAVVGLNAFIRTAISFLAFAIGKSDTMQVFRTEEEALAWIESSRADD